MKGSSPKLHDAVRHPELLWWKGRASTRVKPGAEEPPKIGTYTVLLFHHKCNKGVFESVRTLPCSTYVCPDVIFTVRFWSQYADVWLAHSQTKETKPKGRGMVLRCLQGFPCDLLWKGKRKVLSDSEDDVAVEPTKKATPNKPATKKQM